MHRNIALLFLAASIATIYSDEAGTPWNYDRNDADYGPAAWKNHWPDCAKTRNSPIDLPTNKTNLIGEKLQAWDLVNWNRNSTWTVLDEKYGVKLSLEDGQMIKTSGGGLGGMYEIAQFHFHWASDNTKGGEHTLGEKSFPMEVHFVHKNSEYATLSEAVESGASDALAVLGFFFELQTNDNPNLEVLLNAVTEVRGHENKTVNGFSLEPNTFMGQSVGGSFYRYFGGLTTPGCQEIVEWTVFETPIGISENQMAIIRNQTVIGTGADFFRDVQPRGNREIIKYDANYDPKDYPTTTTPTPSSAHHTAAMSSFTLISLIISKLI